MTQRIGRYLMFDEFARGGMATVHLARLDGSVGFKRILAIKKLSREAADPELRSSIQDEALITSRIVHRNVVQLLDVIEEGSDLFLVMEYVHGLSLSVLLREAKRRKEAVPHRIATAVMADVLDGLQAAHDATDAEGQPLDIVHRDMSPQNVLVGADGVSRVLDFGIAKARVQSKHTTPGLLKGKVAYMAPEQIHGRATRASDLFSTGLILYEALSGQRAIDGFESEAEAMAAILLGKIKPLAELSPRLPAGLVGVVDRALAREPDQRFASARQMAEALRNWSASSPDEVARWVDSLGGATLEQRQGLVRQAEASKDSGLVTARSGGALRQPWIAAAGVGALALAALGLWALLRRPAPVPQPPVAAAVAAVLPTPVVPTAPDAGVAVELPPPVVPHRVIKRAKGNKDCDPPFRIDKNGHKQFKPECF